MKISKFNFDSAVCTKRNKKLQHRSSFFLRKKVIECSDSMLRRSASAWNEIRDNEGNYKLCRCRWDVITALHFNIFLKFFQKTNWCIVTNGNCVFIRYKARDFFYTYMIKTFSTSFCFQTLGRFRWEQLQLYLYLALSCSIYISLKVQ